ncbi:MAG: ribosomal protein S17 [Candidatus Magasanikbacteria bacterium GW2011_GWC2_40_17]|uniref:Small ribosomal subunit protein uS17 n=1 Tax=Candidatus Magasanikbacteria bacterium GW2011_GWA2_42_32 TaxID=1619039 RepID=A0A0G1A6Z6_9BACT|nr:MAG: ribosomal protein S17 [Candidatus Magasanikbacteria bacterium GW2011_GWC2_40_17]KKS56795.1 MAG: ribosomal protein S17 [Candidatus Magasanikbacteria bacterium GW2011_GWA2_42_32]OGH86019.1 MAG: 30S ribosomal protein S17 [Candidatus Magasanikbacteria bacterium RIFOXYB2_FULL_38_10]
MENTKKIRKFKGVVVSAKGQKTVVIRVDRVRKNVKYQKQYTVSNRFQVHDEKGQYKVGDKVNFVECRPISKTKKWRVIY